MTARKTVRETIHDRHPLLSRSPELVEEPEPRKRIARTFYLDLDVVEAIDGWVKDTWVPGQKKPEVSAFVNLAIRKALKQES